MRKTLITAAVLLAGISLPMAASADPYRCYDDNSDQVAGAIVGGLLGGMIGSSVAERGDKTGGTIIGGALGAVAGAAIADGDNCGPRPGYRYDNRYRSGYNTGYGYQPGYSVGVTTYYGGSYNNGYYGRRAPAPRYEYRHDNRRYDDRRHDNRRYDNRRQDNRGRTHSNLQGGYYGGHQATQPNVNVSAFVIATGQTRPSTCRSAERRLQNYDGTYRVVRGQECLTVNGGYRPYGF